MTDKDKIDFSMFLDSYLSDARDGFQELNTNLLALEKDLTRTDLLDSMFRSFHTLKSSSLMLEFFDITNLAHVAEDLLDRLRKGEAPVTRETVEVLFETVDTLEKMVKAATGTEGKPKEDGGVKVEELKGRIESAGSSGSEAVTPQIPGTKAERAAPSIEKTDTVRVHVDLLDALFDLTGELIIIKNRINNLIFDSEDKKLKTALSAMDRMLGSQQEIISAARLVPIDEIFRKFPRMVRDLARENGKEIDLVLDGHEIELDKSMLDAISEPLIHLLRNAVDHGIETAETRKSANKDARGTIKISAKRTETRILIDVGDDGKGIDVARMKDLALGKGLITPEESGSLDEKGVLNLLFISGFTSSTEVTGLSGRGVGLDVVKTSVKKLGGKVDISTEKGKGTHFIIQLPLTTAILQTLLVEVCDNTYAIPTDIVLETLDVKEEYVKEVRDRQVLVLRNQVIPYIRLSDVFKLTRREGAKDFSAVIIRAADGFVALGVDAVLGQTENIVKPFDHIARTFKGFSGGTIMGNGRVALLMDIPSLLDMTSSGERGTT